MIKQMQSDTICALSFDIAEQDKGLDVLAQVIGRQKQMALDIGNEVDVQNGIIFFAKATCEYRTQN